MFNPCNSVYTPCTRSKRYTVTHRLFTVYHLGKHCHIQAHHEPKVTRTHVDNHSSPRKTITLDLSFVPLLQLWMGQTNSSWYVVNYCKKKRRDFVRAQFSFVRVKTCSHEN